MSSQASNLHHRLQALAENKAIGQDLLKTTLARLQDLRKQVTDLSSDDALKLTTLKKEITRVYSLYLRTMKELSANTKSQLDNS